jgi:hypothetical protein
MALRLFKTPAYIPRLLFQTILSLCAVPLNATSLVFFSEFGHPRVVTVDGF